MAAPQEEQDDVENRRENLIRDIERLCYRYKPGEVERILFIGLTGQGKSSVINTIAKQINGEYFQIATVGAGVALSRSREMITYNHCGIALDSIREDGNSSFLRTYDRLPHLVDYAGLEDLDTPELTELFERFIEGAIPPGTSVASIERDQRKYMKVGGLKARYPNSNPDWKVSKIVFVHSCKSPVPTRLIQCLLRALMTTDEDSTTVKFKGSVFLLITKYDLVDPELTAGSDDEDKSSDRDNAPISMDDFRHIEEQLANQFSIEGNLEFNRIRWTSYCSRTGYDNNNVDVIALEFIKQMLMPTITRREDIHVVQPSPWLEARRIAIEVIEGLHLSPREMALVIVVLLLGVFVLFSIGAKAN